VLEQICRAAIAHIRNGDGLLIEYRELPEPALAKLTDHCGLCYGADDLARMHARAQYDAKHPARRYADASDERRDNPSAEIRTLAARFLARLDALQEVLGPKQYSVRDTAPRRGAAIGRYSCRPPRVVLHRP